MNVAIFKSGALALALSLLFTLPAVAGGDADYNLKLIPGEDLIAPFSLVDVEVVLDFPDGNGIQGYQWGICDDEYLTLEDPLTDIVYGAGTIDLSYTFESKLVANDDEDEPIGWTVGALFNVITGDLLEPDDDSVMYICTYEAGGIDPEELVTSTLEFCDTLGSPAVNTQLIVFDSVKLDPVLTNTTIDIGTPERVLGLSAPIMDLDSDSLDASIMLSNPEPEDPDAGEIEIYAFSFGISHDDTKITVSAVEEGAALSDFNDGEGPSYFAAIMDPDGVAGITVACVVSFGPTDFEYLGSTTLEDGDHEVAIVTYDAVVGAEEDSVSPLEFVDDLGSPSVSTVFTIQDAESVTLSGGGIVAMDGEIKVTIPEIPVFVRGDANADGIIDISDPFFLARALFDGGPALTCDDAGDADDNESLGIADVLDILAYLFTGGDDLPEPFSECGPGTESLDDTLLCDESQSDICL